MMNFTGADNMLKLSAHGDRVKSVKEYMNEVAGIGCVLYGACKPRGFGE